MFYQKHIFFCCNKKPNNTGCGFFGGEDGFNFTREYLKNLELWGEGKIRATKSGCLGRCENAPVCVVYPDATWYCYVDEDDIKEIIDKHLINGEIVQRLVI